MILYINACVRSNSRTKILADYLLSETQEQIEELRLSEISFPKVDSAFLDKRDRLISTQQYDNPMFDLARQFARADKIVIASPFWDLSFPATLKQFLEQINVVGITFRYTENGIPVGLCKAKKLYYVTTVGGTYVPEEYGFGYVRALAQNFYGINDVEWIKAVGLDIQGADVTTILQECMRNISIL